ncbi:MAG: GNAT family N-acetyltransferase [bacterium]|nr:GNAT family N-acetyltransferase [bacterium]
MKLRIDSFELNDATPVADRERCFALLRDADPSRANVDDYLARGELYVSRSIPGGDTNAPGPGGDDSKWDSVSDSDSDIVGLYVILETRPRTIEIMNVAVLPELQGQGIGKDLVRHAIERARTKGAKSIEIGTGNSSVGQLALYQKMGFRILGIDFDYFVRFYEEPLYENGIQVRDMIRLAQDL